MQGKGELFMRSFETDVQLIKYKVLRAVAEHALQERLDVLFFSRSFFKHKATHKARKAI